VRRRQETLPWSARIGLAVAAILLLAIWGWLRNADSRALVSMDPDLRGELFRRSRADAEAICARPELEDECRSRLEFLERFPECDASCRALVAAHLRRPVR
jgi:cytochrome b pre-mRNA-processing protein 3